MWSAVGVQPRLVAAMFIYGGVLMLDHGGCSGAHGTSSQV
jgi:hypothetical protein